LVIATTANVAELEISELIASMKKAVMEVQKTASEPYIIIPWLEGEISYVVKKEGEGGFKAYVVTLDAKYATEAIQRVKFRIEPLPGTKWKAEIPGQFKDAFIVGVDQAAKKVFISTTAEKETDVTVPVKITSDTKIADTSGKSQPLSEIHEGATGTIQYTIGRSGDREATVITMEISSITADISTISSSPTPVSRGGIPKIRNPHG
jgi:hypothetical protein